MTGIKRRSREQRSDRPDVFVNDADVVDLDDIKGPDRFYTQCVGSQAG